MNYLSPFPSFATPDLNQRAAALWISLLSTFAIADTLGLMPLEQLAFSYWTAQELARKQSRDLAAGAAPDSPSILRLSRERRAECRLQAQLARQLNQHLKMSMPANKPAPSNSKISNLSNKKDHHMPKMSIPLNNSALAGPNSPLPSVNDLLAALSAAATGSTR